MRPLHALIGFVAFIVVGCATTSTQDLTKSEWTELRNEHFIVYSEVGPHWASRVMEQLNVFRSFVIEHMHLEGTDNPLPFRILLLGGASDLQVMTGRRDVFGAFHSTFRGGLAVVDVNARGLDGTSSLNITYTSAGPLFRKVDGLQLVGLDGVLHEYVHHLLANDSRRHYPLWFNEGYAEYLSTFSVTPGGEFDGGIARIGEPVHHRLEVIDQARWVPLDILFNTVGYDLGHGYGDFYSQAWAVVHFMLSDEERAKQTEIFLDNLNAQQDLNAAFEGAYGMPIQELSAKARSRAKSGKRFKIRKFDLQPVEYPEPAQRILPQDEVHRIVAETLLTFTEKREEAEALLQTALDLNPRNGEARALMANLHLANQRLSQSIDVLEEGGELAKMDPAVLCQWGHVTTEMAWELVRANRAGWQERIEEARQYYERAIKIDDTYAEAYAGLGRSYLLTIDGDRTRGFEALDIAETLLPVNMETHLVRGHLYFAQEQNDKAKAEYEAVIHTGRHNRIVRQAKDMIKILEEAEDTQEPDSPKL